MNSLVLHRSPNPHYRPQMPRNWRNQAIALIENSRLQKHNLANCSATKRSAKIRAQLHIQETQYYNSAVRFAKFSLP
jgi:hypothetical protein